jgi:FSR family fosmidomycin resistance protein-like MFS transporter
MRQSLARRRGFIVHSFAHLINDSYSGFLAPLLPLLAAKHGLGLTGAGLFAGILTLSASLSQPLWGMASDRRPHRLYIPGGILAAGFFLSLMGLAANPIILALVIILGGMGVASFHPMGTMLASALAAQRKGLAIALYITAGSVGYALGPILISNLVAHRGLESTYLAILPALFGAAAWLWLGPRDGFGAAGKSLNASQPALLKKVNWNPIFLLSAISFIRSFVLVTFLNFLPFHLQGQGMGLQTRGLYLFTLQFGDAMGTLIGGTLSDRWGRWRIMFASPILAPIMLLAFLQIEGPAALIPLFIAGMLLFASAPAVIISAQKLMPGREGIASALQIGFAFGTSGLLMTGIGRAGETYGLMSVFLAVAFMPLIMVVLAWKLRPHRAGFEASLIT